MIQMSKDAKLHAIPALYWSPCQNILSNFTERRREMGGKISFHQIRIDIFVSLPFAVGRLYQELQFIWIKKKYMEPIVDRHFPHSCVKLFAALMCWILTEFECEMQLSASVSAFQRDHSMQFTQLNLGNNGKLTSKI